MSLEYQFTDMLRKTVFHPWSVMLDGAREFVTQDYYPLKATPVGRFQAAWLESASRMLSYYPKLDFGITEIEVDGRTQPVTERVLVEEPFCHLVHFQTDKCETRPKVLFVAALSGHHATLARESYSAFLPDHDVYVTDWQDARFVPVSEGGFGFEDYVRYLIKFFDYLGPDTHVVGICQAAVPVLTAVAAMAGGDVANRPRSMTLMAGPIDIRASSNVVTQLAELSNASVYRKMVHTVPAGYPGAGRKVYPGLIQLFGFMSLNMRAHWQKHWQFFFDIYNQEHEAADKHREFYDEYFAVLDVTEEFFLETLERIFFNQHLATGVMQHDGETVDCAAITDVPLLTVEGGEDDICPVGMTQAAHELCVGLTDAQRLHYVQSGAGHYGVFSGSRYRKEIAPRIKTFIAEHA